MWRLWTRKGETNDENITVSLFYHRKALASRSCLNFGGISWVVSGQVSDAGMGRIHSVVNAEKKPTHFFR